MLIVLEFEKLEAAKSATPNLFIIMEEELAMLDIMIKRRSIRKFKNTKILKEDIDKIIQAALLAPSSRSRKSWNFIIVTDEELLKKLALSKEHGSQFLKDAPLGIVVIADGTDNDVWVEDTSIASIIIQLQAESINLGSCWIQIRNRMHNINCTSEDYIKELLDIPENYKVESIIAIGHPNEVKQVNKIEELEYGKVFRDKYGKN